MQINFSELQTAEQGKEAFYKFVSDRADPKLFKQEVRDLYVIYQKDNLMEGIKTFYSLFLDANKLFNTKITNELYTLAIEELYK